MKIHAPRLVERDGLACAEAAFESPGGGGSLWFGVAPGYAEGLVTARADGFLVALLVEAMRRGEDVEVLAPVSARLHYNLTRGWQQVMSILVPALRPVRITAEVLEDAPLPCAGGVGTGFSAGVDAFSVVRDHFVQPTWPGHRLTHLTFTNVGSHGEDARAASRLFRARYDAIRGYPDSVGLPFVAIDSNLGQLLPLPLGQTHAPRHLAAALVLQGLFRRYYYASTFSYHHIAVQPDEDCGVADPVALPLLSTETLDFVAAGSQHTRVEKIRDLADVPGAERWLNVCTADRPDGRNCSTCPKCCRTLYTLELLGMVDRFSAAFDMAAWSRERNRYIVQRILNGSPPKRLTREMLDYAEEIGRPFPFRLRATALLLRPVPRLLYRLGRGLRRRWER